MAKLLHGGITAGEIKFRQKNKKLNGKTLIIPKNTPAVKKIIGFLHFYDPFLKRFITNIMVVVKLNIR
jgi:hypothetical protein